MQRTTTKLGIVLLVVASLLAPLSAFGFKVPGRAHPLSTVKMMNYYPARHGWGAMWTHWDPGQMNDDFHVIATLHANTVRLIVQPSVFGYPYPSSTMRQRLAYAVGLASGNGLRVQLTLFDLWSNYGDVSGSKNWARLVLKRFRRDSRIQSIEVKNEMDSADPAAVTWARQMIPYVRIQQGTTPVTISSKNLLSSLLTLRQGLAGSPGNGGQPDFYTYHYYDSPSQAQGKLEKAKEIVAPKELFIGETGTPSGYGGPSAPTDGKAEQAQVDFFAAVQHAARNVGLPAAAPWIFQDPIANTFLPSEPQWNYHMGLLRVDGSEKPAAAWIRWYFLT
jgi:hypothetical protein